MALIKCSECGKEISDKAKTCPNCRIAINNSEIQKKKAPVSIVIGIILIIFGASLVANSMSSILFNNENTNTNSSINSGFVNNKIGEITYSVSNKWILTEESGDHIYYPFDNVGIIISSTYYNDITTTNKEEKDLLYEKIANALLDDVSIEKKEDEKTLNGITWRTYNFVEEREYLIYSYINDNSGYVTTIILGETNKISDKSKETFDLLLNSIRFENQNLNNDLNEIEKSITLVEKNALAKAKSYLAIMPYSYSGLIEQLEFEGFTTEEATYGVDNCGADWNEQAAKKAQMYLSIMAYSRSGLIQQLEFEGFTTQQAEYGATAVGY